MTTNIKTSNLTTPGIVAAVENAETLGKPESSDQPVAKRVRLEDCKEQTVTTTDESQQDALVTSTVGLRRFKRIPIFIVDYHNDVLEFIYRCLASRHLPLENNTLLHFDSHPDMVISREIPASAAYDKETMLGELSIENWIMPACYAGHFNRVIWMKNSWCKQMPVGKYNFKVGHRGNKISVDCPLDYFISEGNYCQTSELEQARDLELQVLNNDAERPPDPKLILAAEDCANYILDIDLDFFSTSNPFLEIYKDANCYEQLSEIFHFESATESNASGTTEKRKQQLEVLKRIFEHLEEKRTFEGLAKPDTNIVSEEIFKKIENLADSLQKCYADDEIDWLVIFDSGSTTDTNGLPHHISTDTELELYYQQFKQFLIQMPHPPVLITMACSAEDDYCPRNQVNCIQERVVKILQEVFQEKVHEKPILHYMDDEWDVMQL
ncbi:misexpression suppressor of ras 6 [Glossina fuscipes fuscipes]|uniref:Uncharacterized protein n=1 Tax=Glossina palpalis gambiensis TaxID=67801 RepID=A0A1B0ALK9_9MUSC